MVELFNMPTDDYKRFLGVLRKYQCHMPFQQFRSASIEPPHTAGTCRRDAANRLERYGYGDRVPVEFAEVADVLAVSAQECLGQQISLTRLVPVSLVWLPQNFQ